MMKSTNEGQVEKIRRTTIKDVAKAAGVSVATVSRVLNGRGVKKATLDKVTDTIDKLGFSPDLAARSMVNKETKSIGLLIPQLSNEFWARMSEAIQEQLWLNGYSIVLGFTNYEMDREEAFLKMFRERRVDGIIFGVSSPTLAGNDYSHLEELKSKYPVPFVSLDQNIPDMSGVVSDQLQSAMNAVEHLIRLGNRNIAYIGGPAVSIYREFGYRQALAMYGLPINEQLIKLGSGQSLDFGYEALKELLATKQPFSAIFCGNDLIAMGAIHALNQAGIRVPEDVAIVGYDDIQIAALMKPSLTTVRQPIGQISKELIKLLLQTIESPDEGSMPKKILVPNELVIRDSCGANLHSTSQSHKH